jgi:hypothetical protein
MGINFKQSQKSCPRCLSDKTIRIILWGLPAEEPDPSIYTLGGCCVEGEVPEMECIDCGWQGSKLDVKKATRRRRFIWTDEDAPGIIYHRKFTITDEILDELQTSEIWMSAKSFTSQFTPKSIYGPEGKISWLWGLSWDSEDAMRSDFYTNMGGGVPIEIIDKLIQIIVSKNLRQ